MDPITRKEFQDLLERLAGLERQLVQVLELSKENQGLRTELRAAEQELAVKTLEVERLKNDLLHQKHVWEKEVERVQKSAAERESLLRQDAAEKLALAQQFFDRQVQLEKERYLERSLREKDKLDRQLDDYQQDESWWSRLLRLLTWN
ncbi:MAG TPA: hypothetical protein DCZ69_18750 [Syntrophobacteraceae bacterium]|nr:hypothetical protein [Syntrophobacteraceae bacterium]HBZ54544.1 hypothetical protein [Syntrophobacteraceae bacterium]